MRPTNVMHNSYKLSYNTPRRDDTQTVAAPTPIPIPRPNWPRFNSDTRCWSPTDHAEAKSLLQLLNKTLVLWKKRRVGRYTENGLFKRLENLPKHKVVCADRPTHLASYTETRSSSQTLSVRDRTPWHMHTRTRRSTRLALLMALRHCMALACPLIPTGGWITKLTSPTCRMKSWWTREKILSPQNTLLSVNLTWIAIIISSLVYNYHWDVYMHIILVVVQL